jgi:predicted nucleic acid-binding protein
MLSIDANILLYAYSEAAPEHDRALACITAQSRNKLCL